MTDQPIAEIVEVTPALAETWLSKNPNIRNLHQAVVDAYARDMAADRWRLNGETGKFSASGQLFDGQHRLNAVVQSGRTVPMVVIRGLSPDVMPTVDEVAQHLGVVRSRARQLHDRGKVQFEVAPNGRRYTRRHQLEVIANARDAKRTLASLDTTSESPFRN